KLTLTIDPLGNRTEYLYNHQGLLIRVDDALGNFTVQEYDPFGTVKLSRDQLGNVTRYINDGNGNHLSQTTTRTMRSIGWSRPPTPTARPPEPPTTAPAGRLPRSTSAATGRLYLRRRWAARPH